MVFFPKLVGFPSLPSQKPCKTQTFGSREHVVHGSTWESPFQLQAFTHVRHRNLTRSEIKPSTRDPETNSLSHLKMDGWNTIVSFWESLLSGAMLVLGRVTTQQKSSKTWDLTIAIPSQQIPPKRQSTGGKTKKKRWETCPFTCHLSNAESSGIEKVPLAHPLRVPTMVFVTDVPIFAPITIGIAYSAVWCFFLFLIKSVFSPKMGRMESFKMGNVFKKRRILVS